MPYERNTSCRIAAGIVRAPTVPPAQIWATLRFSVAPGVSDATGSTSGSMVAVRIERVEPERDTTPRRAGRSPPPPPPAPPSGAWLANADAHRTRHDCSHRSDSARSFDWSAARATPAERAAPLVVGAIDRDETAGSLFELRVPLTTGLASRQMKPRRPPVARQTVHDRSPAAVPRPPDDCLESSWPYLASAFVRRAIARVNDLATHPSEMSSAFAISR